MSKTGIPYIKEVGGETCNCVVGCTPCSIACDNCGSRELHNMRYAAYYRYKGGSGLPIQYAKPFEEIQLFPERLKMLNRKKPTVFFMCSGSDLFHKDVPDDFIDLVFARMALKPQHIFLVLTKRIKRAEVYFDNQRHCKIAGVASKLSGISCLGIENPLPNIYLGITVWNQESADRDIPILLECWKGKTWISAKPLLGDVNIAQWLQPWGDPFNENRMTTKNPLTQVIVGCESGPCRRYCPENWIRNIVQQCNNANVPVYVKQIARSDGKVITDPKLFPQDLQRREMIW